MARQSQLIVELLERYGPAEEIRLRCPRCNADGTLVVNLVRRLAHCVTCTFRGSVAWLLDPTDPAKRDDEMRRLMNPGRDIIA